ncbi:unnamed protein product [Rotaria magnacalcarata]|uniref:G domain-containing protein n=1 Tax=Rotaria magnacalcarata TaxID=392030 RepID=A0A8S2N5K9_9BILA|nr:unnamed protein product [Rotaria magnacalcarata]
MAQAANNNRNFENNNPLALTESPYDFIIHLSDPNAILDSRGFSVQFPQGKQSYDDKVKSLRKCGHWFVVNVVGRYNVGKTYVVQLLSGINLDHSFVERTQGVSVSLPVLTAENRTMIALIDTAGSRTPVTFETETKAFSDATYLKQVTDSFIQQVAFKSAEIFIFVLNQLTLDDELALSTLYDRLKDNDMKRREVKGRLVLVHNYFNLSSTIHAEKVVEYELQGIFGARKCSDGYWMSDNFKHFVLINNNTDEGNQYNENSIEQLRAVIKGSSVQATEDVLKATIDSIQYQLNLIVEQTSSETGSDETAPTNDACATGAAKVKVSKNDYEIIRTAPIQLELEIKQVTVDSTERQPKWIICTKSPIPANIKLSKNLKFKDDGSVSVDHSSVYVPNFQISRLEDGDMEILVECPEALLPTINHTVRGHTIIIEAEKHKN